MSYFSLFQSTHPARGATRSGFLTPTVDQFQSTPPARGATFRCLDKKPLFGFQSTHPARGATRRYVCTNEGWRFQSTHPARGATNRRAGVPGQAGDFNPRTPRGVRPTSAWPLTGPSIFQSTHPARGATLPLFPRDRIARAISIHAPREGCDADIFHRPAQQGDFNPRTPRGVRRLLVLWKLKGWNHFNPRTPRGVRPFAIGQRIILT